MNQPITSKPSSNSPQASQSDSDGKQSFQISAPSISLPKGGGAIRGMGEKFAANPVTGTGSMSVPIATSPGRSGFGPQLSLSYDSGAGNGPFGFGWSLSLPSITRKTDKGLPKYRNADDSDVFILSGAEDLVPLLVNNNGKWEREELDSRTVDDTTYEIERYRPRIEGLFARIERWSNPNDRSDVFWRSISKDNITTWYGKTDESRISDPNDKARIFSWLICQTYDDKGNVIVYQYKPEDSHNVDLSQVHERNRTDKELETDKSNRTANRYLKRICYGNRKPYLPKLTPTAWPQPPDPTAVSNPPNYFFEVVFDYDDGHYAEDAPDAEGRIFARPVYKPPTSAKWKGRVDPFSTYRAGFEVRTYRLCQRVLMFHHFPGRDELGTPDCLVRSTDFTYSYEDNPTDVRNPIYSFLNSVSQSGYVRQSENSYLKKSLPPLQFEYTKPVVQDIVHDVDPESLENLPYGLDGSTYRWVDLDGEGLSGILTEQADGWYYKRNLSPVNLIGDNGSEHAEARFGALEVVTKKPSLAAISAGGQQFLDLAGDGQLDLVALSGPTPGFFERTQDENWEPFKSFRSLPNVEWNNPNLKFVDLTGDGHADILITEDDVFWWHPSLAEDGFGPAERVPQNWDEEKGPRLVFADLEHSIYLGDLSGDGLSDLVRIRNGEVCYWPNLGYGRFGAKVTMDNSPWFDNPDQFDPRRIQLADIDGSGTTDIIYVGRTGIDLYFNHSGNGWSKLHPLKSYPHTDNLSSVTAMDLLGNGTACLVWSSPLPGNARRPMRYIDLMGGTKPHLMIKTRNNLGATTEVQYAPSTKFYVEDKLAGKPWITKMPFPVHVIEKTIITDDWRKTEFSTSYSYHHGYYDGIEREFRGFGRVEQVDVEDYGTFKTRNKNNPYVTDDDKLYQPPVKTVTWFHTGAFLDRERILSHFEDEYFPAWYEALDPTKKNVLGTFQESHLPEPDLNVQGLLTEEWREAFRACKGMTLRQEVYELDVQAVDEKKEHRPVKLFSTAYHNCHIQRLQPRERNHHAVFLVTESESITYHYELNLPDSPIGITPDPRIAHTLNLKTDEFGNVLQSVAVVYPRLGRHVGNTLPPLPPGTEDLIASVQTEPHLAYTENRFTDKSPPDPDNHRLPASCEVLTYELTGIHPEDEDDQDSSDPRNNPYFTIDELRDFRLSDVYQTEGKEVGYLDYHKQPDGSPQKRLMEHVRMLYFKENLTDPEAFGVMNRLGIPFETYKLALTDDLLTAVFGSKMTADVRASLSNPSVSGYLDGTDMQARFGNKTIAGQHWIRSGIVGFNADAPQHFYLPERYIDPFGQLNNGNVTTLNYNPYGLYVQSSTDPLGNPVTVTQFDFRVLAPSKLKDPNDNYSAVAFDALGMPIAWAIMGKNQNESGDNLDTIRPDISVSELEQFFGEAYATTKPQDWLDKATGRFVYTLGEQVENNGKLTYGHHPAGACAILREQHVKQALAAGETKIQVAVEYSDGSGNVLVKKSQAEPDPNSTEREPPLRWIASGKTVVTNKGKPVKQYEPYFSKTEHSFDPTEATQETGVTPAMFYDSVGRLIRTELPDGSFSRVEFSPWHVKTFDANDTVTESQWYVDRGSPPSSDPEPSDPDQRAAWLAALHGNTPAETHLDSLRRDVVSVTHNKYKDAQGTLHDEKYVSFTKLDAEGKPLWIRDAHGNLVIQYITPIKPTRWTDDSNENIPVGAVPSYDIAGNLLFQHSMDSGDRWMLNDAAGKPMFAWDLNERQQPDNSFVNEDRFYCTAYDALHRPTTTSLRINNDDPQMIERFEYQDAQANQTANLNGQLVRHYDPSGLIESVKRDFKGNVLEVARRLTNQPTESMVDWQGDPRAKLEAEPIRQVTEYDAFNRMILHYNWHRAAPNNRVVVYKPAYNARGLLASENLTVRARKTVGGFDTTTETKTSQEIKEIRYNIKGEKSFLRLGNDTVTHYDYDPKTFRLRQMRTTRPTYDQPFPNYRADLKDPKVLQQLHYKYDPVGNITEINDEAYRPAFFQNAIIEPRSLYEYDALYRLIKATGREDGATNWAPQQIETTLREVTFSITDPKALRKYTQTYQYDHVDNIKRMRHEAGATGSWTRDYAYAFEDQTQPASNRLWQTWTGGDRTQATTYGYDMHGNILNLASKDPRFNLRWDHRDMISGIDLGGGGQAYYQYDADKQRTRKRIVNQDNLGGHWERIYLGGYELYRRYNGDGTTVVEEIESHHLLEGGQRILLVDDVLKTDRSHASGTPYKTEPIFRYQYSNHLGSACLELDHKAELISYEEYHAYGTSSYRAVKSGIEAPPGRYRYTGMERDEESGVSYHKTRSYCVWLGRWASVDPQTHKPWYSQYSYVPTNTLNATDRSGQAPIPQGTTPQTLLGEARGIVSGQLLPHLSRDTLQAIQAEAQGSGVVNPKDVNYFHHVQNVEQELQRARQLSARIDTLSGDKSVTLSDGIRAELASLRKQLGTQIDRVRTALATARELRENYSTRLKGIKLFPGRLVEDSLRAYAEQRGLKDLATLLPDEPAFKGVMNEINKLPRQHGATVVFSLPHPDALRQMATDSAKVVREAAEATGKTAKRLWEAGERAAPKVSRGVSYVMTVSGAQNATEKYQRDTGDYGPQPGIFFFMALAGVVDDGLMGLGGIRTGGAHVPVLLDTWEREGSGPAQVGLRDVLIATQKWLDSF